MAYDLPATICFRVTRYCNARCGFCLAPPDGAHPDAAMLARWIDWLVAHHVRTLHFCGGEPTIHPGLPHLLEYARALGAKTKLTTNGIVLSDALLATLRATRTQVKVSVHGDREHHDAIVGCEAFEHATRNLRRLVTDGVAASVQTTIVAGSTHVVDWMIRYCLDAHVRRLSILPFIPRGDGLERRGEYELSANERSDLRRLVATRRRELGARLDLRWLDFNAQPIHVVEADGRVVIERATESMDEVICRIPAPQEIDLPRAAVV
jgi:MoaA/NifB/PqqE/SkfB family radical SAM enzyme